MIRPTVSVVVPTRNRSGLLARTLRSVLGQQGVDLEVIVVDEASHDDTAAAIAGLADPRIRVLHHHTPLGVSAARNSGARDAQSEWLAFVDDDDLWAPDKLVGQLDAAQAVGRNWAYAGSVTITDRDRILSGRPPLAAEEMVAVLPRHNAIPGGGSNVVLRRRMWLQAGPFDTRLRNTEDWEMWIRLAKHGPPACVSRPLIAYRVHTANSSLDIAEIVRGAKLIESLHDTRVDWGVLHRWMAESCLRRGQRSAALRQFLAAGVRGELSGVVADLAAILRRRVALHRRSVDGEFADSADPWKAEAARWLSQSSGHQGDSVPVHTPVAESDRR
jgi:glycosyltransferase involved in cell wall biosynthesis